MAENSVQPQAANSRTKPTVLRDGVLVLTTAQKPLRSPVLALRPLKSQSNNLTK